MPEAVIVATARSPIGRAGKGSLKDVRPDDLAAQMMPRHWTRSPPSTGTQVDDVNLGCGHPGGESGFNMARIVNVLNGMDDVPGATITRYCASSVQTTRMAFHAIKAGEGDVFVSAGVETVSRYLHGSSDLARHPQPAVRRRPTHAGPHQPPVARPGTTRARTAWSRRLHRDGPDRRERRQLARPEPPGADEFGVRSQNLAEKATTTASGPARSPRSRRPTARS